MERLEQKSWIINLISVIVILGMFAVACLVLTNIGINSYKNIVMTNDANFELRTSLNFVATKVRQSDTRNYPRIMNIDGTDCLVLGEEINQIWYETVIYYKDGYLYELFQEASDEYILDYGLESIEISSFFMYFNTKGNLVLKAENSSGEQEELTLMLRSGR